MTPIALDDMKATSKNIRGLVWCQARVRSRDSTWETRWKWCVGVYCPRQFADEITNPWSWFIPGISDARVEVLEQRILAFIPMPDDWSPAA